MSPATAIPVFPTVVMISPILGHRAHTHRGDMELSAPDVGSRFLHGQRTRIPGTDGHQDRSFCLLCHLRRRKTAAPAGIVLPGVVTG